ncbi:hypothetical protein PUMCH_000768 [Australozyma saopauloensis]|uniref:DUF218 domain-containing protein n=1 Tax=Australozyma saopauloensis TaxID=291208 RepID=A0AAX4H514_9ASCO|nr:hypothetical protein PUMCH_000768 [[Candida] saopauloensis]
MKGSNHLVILPCHSIWKGGSSLGLDQDEWWLAPFQYEGQDHLCFREHIEECVRQLKSNLNAILVLSGGRTKKEAGPISESESYYNLLKLLAADDLELIGDRIVLEEYARDSFENVLFSLCRFNDLTESYPQYISVVGFEFKRTRFVEHHLSEALGFPKERVFYIGNAPYPGKESDHTQYFEDLDQAEKKHALDHFKKDFYGVRHPLSTKKNGRNPFNSTHQYALSNPQLEVVLREIIKSESTMENDDLRESISSSWYISH